MKHIVKVISVTTILLFSLNSGVMSQITSFKSDTKMDYIYGEIGTSEFNGVNLKAGYTWSLYKLLNTDISFGLGLRVGEIDSDYAYDSISNRSYYEKSNIGLQPSIGYQFYTEKMMFEPQLTFDLSSAFGGGVGFNTVFNRFLIGVHLVAYSSDTYFGAKIGYTFPKEINPRF